MLKLTSDQELDYDTMKCMRKIVVRVLQFCHGHSIYMYHIHYYFKLH